jgi:hypothetical protein
LKFRRWLSTRPRGATFGSREAGFWERSVFKNFGFMFHFWSFFSHFNH